MAHARITLSYDEYLSLPEDTRPLQIMDGEPFMLLAPSARYQQIVGAVYRELHAYVTRHHLGQVLFSPLDVVLSRSRYLCGSRTSSVSRELGGHCWRAAGRAAGPPRGSAVAWYRDG